MRVAYVKPVANPELVRERVEMWHAVTHAAAYAVMVLALVLGAMGLFLV